MRGDATKVHRFFNAAVTKPWFWIMLALLLLGTFMGPVLPITIIWYGFPFRIYGRFEKGIGTSISLSPDGRLLAYSSVTTGHGDIYVADADGSNPRRLTSN